MPWSDCEYGRAICDGCRAASKAADLTGRISLHKIGAYVPRHSGTEVIYCPICIMTKPEAHGGLASHSMSWDKARKLFESHWHTPEDALALGHTAGMVQAAARPEPPEPPAGQRDQNHQSQQVPPGMIQAAARPEPPEPPVGQRDQNHQSQQVPPGMIQAAALTPALAIADVSGRVEQSPLAAVVDELKAEVDMLKAEVCELKEELKLVKTGVARDEELETLQNEIRALKEQLTAQTRPRLTPAQIVHVSG